MTGERHAKTGVMDAAGRYARGVGLWRLGVLYGIEKTMGGSGCDSAGDGGGDADCDTQAVGGEWAGGG